MGVQQKEFDDVKKVVLKYITEEDFKKMLSELIVVDRKQTISVGLRDAVYTFHKIFGFKKQ